MLTLLPAATCSVDNPTSQPPLLTKPVEFETAAAPDLRPIRMIARDGTDMPLVSLEVRGSVEDPLAFTQLTLAFENPDPRPLDGTFDIRLPAAATVTRFAAQVEGSWREAEVVERKPGALQPSLYDAAKISLDEQPDGDQHFRVKLPSIPGRSTQRLILSYSEVFERADMAYRVRLAGLGSIPSFRARVVVRSQPDPLLAEVYDASQLLEQLGIDEQGRRILEIPLRAWTSDEDFVVPTSGLRRTGVRSGRKIAARINPLTHDHTAPLHSLTLLFDTSASRAVGYEQRVEELAALVEALQPWTGDELWLRIVAFDQGFATVYEGRMGEIDRGVFDDLRRRRALGASNLASVLSHLHNLGDALAGPPPVDPEEEDERLGRTGNRVVLIGDGMATAGVSERSRLLKAVAELAEVGVERVDVIADHGRRDDWTLRTMVRQLDQSGLVLDSLASPRQVVRRLLRTVHDDVKISVPGARWYYPEVVHGVQSDDEILVYADVETRDAQLRVTVESHGKESWEVPLVEVEEPLVDRAHDQAVVRFLVETLEDKAEGQSLAVRKDLWRKIIENSKKNRVLNAYTRLEMLADEDDYQRARLLPGALPNILVAGADAVEVRVREFALPPVEEGVAPPYVRLPRFASETLEVEQLLLLAQEDVSAGPSGLSSADADAVMAVGELADTEVEGVPTNPLESFAPPSDSPAAELLRMLRAKPAERRRTRPRVRPPLLAPDAAYRGNLLAIMNLLEWGNVAEAKEFAWRWREAEPAEVMALVALGEALEASEDYAFAARAYGSIIDLYPDRADMRRFAGSRLEHLGTVGNRLAIDTYKRARQQRPDHPSSHRLLAFALLRAGRHERAFDVLEAGLRRDWEAAFAGAFVGVEKVLREDLGLIAAAWRAQEPAREAEIRRRLDQLGGHVEDEASLRFVLTWETGANDVDLHVRDGSGSHAYYDSRGLSSGGALYFDVTDGYGPEVFTILGKPTGYPYNLQVHYYARGPNGYGMGKVQVVEHDGHGNLAFDERPFVVMKDHAKVDLGDLEGSLAGRGEPAPFVAVAR